MNDRAANTVKVSSILQLLFVSEPCICTGFSGMYMYWLPFLVRVHLPLLPS
uniref:Uncharacterized protein n=1 Tax=Arundo donax TaxID=35708 RepID=A0A0A9E5L7_ARUDO